MASALTSKLPTKLASDLNWDMARSTSFVEKTGLVSLWSSHPVPFTHVHTDGKSKSTIDHILMSPRLVPLVSDCGVVERGDNLSRHCPIWVKLRLGALPVRQPTKTWVPKRTCWFKVSASEVDSYTATLQSKLLSLGLPDSVWCADPHCDDNIHCQEGDQLVLNILDSIVKSSQTTLPDYGGRWVGGMKNRKQGRAVPQ